MKGCRQRAEIVLRELLDERVVKANWHGVKFGSFKICRMKNLGANHTKESRIRKNPDLIIAPKVCVEYGNVSRSII